jgi:hypothetical protein
MQILFREGEIQDGKLVGCGRVVIHRGQALASNNRMTDHNNLLRAFAARFRLDRDEVIAKAVRLYFRIEGGHVVVCGVRQIDNEAVCGDLRCYGLLIMDAVSMA